VKFNNPVARVTSRKPSGFQSVATFKPTRTANAACRWSNVTISWTPKKFAAATWRMSRLRAPVKGGVVRGELLRFGVQVEERQRNFHHYSPSNVTLHRFPYRSGLGGPSTLLEDGQLNGVAKFEVVQRGKWERNSVRLPP
jgi:hypothetical protein